MCIYMTITYGCGHTERIRKSTHKSCEVEPHEYIDSANMKDPGSHCTSCLAGSVGPIKKLSIKIKDKLDEIKERKAESNKD
jgi:hypothetical protein